MMTTKPPEYSEIWINGQLVRVPVLVAKEPRGWYIVYAFPEDLVRGVLRDFTFAFFRGPMMSLDMSLLRFQMRASLHWGPWEVGRTGRFLLQVKSPKQPRVGFYYVYNLFMEFVAEEYMR